ncbi:hypothetical protein NM688_g6140 [Phlebia brevispora]|uniref:Uncharacterized protein n=1 Tax=Phlebia brevispora TaxID=194682 RepID=A0ACC1SJC1_9APHY|nr:hypothetical protein NM688_g6140 [Phlebia brevispora]
MVDLNHEVVTTPRTAGTSSKHSTSSPSSGYISSKYGTHIASSPLTESPASLSSPSGDIISTSLPATMSPLSTDVDFDLAPFGSSSPRTPSREHFSSSHLAAHGHSNLRVPASMPSSRKSSAASLDRDAILHLDMKRLLSKPAKPSHSGSSIISLPSDQELSSASPSPRNLRSFADLSKKPDGRGHTRSGNVTDSGVSPTPLRTLREVSSRASLPAAATEAESKQTQKPRNVLRRKPSARSNPATPTITTFRTTEDPNSTPRSSRTIQVVSRATLPRRTTSAMAEPVSVSRVRRNNTTPAGLTPAGQVALAYKQQEQRREELAEISGWNEQMRQEGSYRSVDSPLRRTDEEDEEGSGAYYTGTVLGTWTTILNYH